MAGTDRLSFLDGLRGLAIVLMVLNHTARWWIERPMGWLRYQLVYVTLTLAAPIFLFLVGFCLPLSFARVTGNPDRTWTAIATKYVKRALRILLGGYLLNLALFREDPVYAGGVLQTIGLGILVSLPILALLQRFRAETLVLLAAAAMYGLFVPTYGWLTDWVSWHPQVGYVLFFDFAPWPWLAMVLIGLALGWRFAATDPADRPRYFALAGAGGLVLLAIFTVWELTLGPTPHIHFRRDFVLNHHWIPRGMTLVWIFGCIFGLLGLAYYVMEVRRVGLRWLVILGQSALMLYLVHQAIILEVVRPLMGGTFTRWWPFWLANVLLMAALVVLAAAWQELKTRWRRRGALSPRPEPAA